MFPPGRHTYHGDGALNSWPNPEVVAEVAHLPTSRNRATRKSEMIQVAQSTAAETHVNPTMDGPRVSAPPVFAPPPVTALYRAEDPPNAGIAADAYEPIRGTARERVAAFLQDHQDEWVDMTTLRLPSIGGSSGDRRARELRQMGHPVENRQSPESPNIWQWRWNSQP